MANQINFDVGFNVNQNDLANLKKSLQDVQNFTLTAFKNVNGKEIKNANDELAKIINTADTVEIALNRAFNKKLNTLNVSKFNAELKKSNLTIKDIYNDFSKAGAVGQTAFRKLATEVLTSNTELKKTKTILDKMGDTLANTLKWNLASGAINRMAGAAQEALGYIKALDSSLNNIRIVTGKTTEEMRKFAKEANSAAQSLGAKTTDYTDASLIYYQQGLADEEVKARTETTLKAANVTGQSGKEVSEQLTAVWNGYKVTAEETEVYVDKLAAVAASTASDLEELSIGMSKVASAANSMGVDVDQLNGMLSTIISVTRQAPESAGTALKTIFARMEDLKLNGEDEDGVSLGDVSSDLKSMGVEIMDAQGNMKDLGGVIEEVGAKWNDGSWSDAEKQALAISLAGKRQYNNLMALFDGWEMYTTAVKTSTNATGTLQNQQDIHMDKITAHLQQMKTATEGVYTAIGGDMAINDIIDNFTELLNVTSKWIDSIGGGKNLLLTLGSLAERIFSKQIAKGISSMVLNLQNSRSSIDDIMIQLKTSDELKGFNNEILTTIATMKSEILSYGDIVSEEQMKEANGYIKEIALLKEKKKLIDDSMQSDSKASGFIERMHTYDENPDTENSLALDMHFTESFDTFKNKNSKNASDQDREKAKNLYENNQLSFNYLYAEIDQAKDHTKELGDAFNILWDDAKKGTDEYRKAQKTVVKVHKHFAKDLKNMNVLLDENSDSADSLKKALANFKVGDVAGADAFNKIFNPKSKKIELNNIITLFKKALAEVQSTAEETEITMENAFNGESEKLEKDIENMEGNFENLKKPLDLTKKIEDINNIVSAVGQLTSAVQMLKNVGNIVTDENLSQGDKILQTIEALTTAIPMLAVGLLTLGQTFGIVKIGADAAAVSTATYKTFTFGAEKAQLALNKAMLKNPIFIVAMAFTALIPIIQGVINHYEKLKEEKQENAKAARELAEKEAEANQKEADATFKLLEQYRLAKHELDGTIESKNKLSNITDKLCKALGVEGSAVTALGLEYDELTKKILESQAAKLQKGITSDEDLHAENNEGAKTAIDSAEGGSILHINEVYRMIPHYGWFGSPERTKEINITDVIAEWVKNSGDDRVAWDPDFYHLEFDEKMSYTEILQYFDKIYKHLLKTLHPEELSKSNTFQYIKSIVEKGKDVLTSETQIQPGEERKKAQLADVQTQLEMGNPLSIDTLEEYEAYKAKYIEKLKVIYGDTKSEEEIKKITDDYFLNMGNLTAFAAENLQKEKFEKGIKEKGFNETEVDAFKKQIEEEGGWKFFASFDINEEDSLSDIKYKYQQVKAKLDLEDIDVKFSVVNDAQKTLQAGESLSKEQIDALKKHFGDAFNIDEFNASSAIEQMEKLVSLNNQLVDEANQYTTEVQKLPDISKEAEKANRDEIEKTTQELENAKKELEDFNNHSDDTVYIEAQEKVGKLQEKLDKLKEKDYSITIDIQTEVEKASMSSLEQQVNNIVGQVETLSSLSKMIGEDYIVDAENVQALAAAYPEVLLKAQEMEGGRIRLNQETVQTVLGGNLEIIKSNKDVAKQQLEDKIILLDAEIQYQQNKLDILEGVLKGDIEISDAEKQLDENEAKYKEELTNSLGEDQYNAMVEATHMQADNTQNTLDNLDILDKRIAEISTHYAKMLSGEEVQAATAGSYKAIYGDIYTHTDSSTVEDSIRKEIDKARGEGTTDKMLQDVQNTKKRLDTLVKNRAAAVSALSKLDASTSEGFDSINNAYDGKGGEEQGEAKDPEVLEYLEEEFDRYHDIDKEINKVTHDLEQLQKAQNNLMGQDLLNNLNKQLKVLEKQRDIYYQKLDITRQEAQELKNQLVNAGTTFDQDGYISNYTNVLQSKLDYVNNIIAQYNAMSAEEQESFKETVEAAEQEYENFKSQIERYDELISSSIPELENQIEDTLYQEVELQLEKFNIEITLRLDMAEAERNWNNFKRKIIDGISDEDLTGKINQAKNDFLSYYNTAGSNVGSVQAQTQHVGDILAELTAMNTGGHSTVYSAYDKKTGTWVDNTKQAFEDLKSSSEGLMTTLEEIADLENELNETFLSSIDAINDAFSTQQEEYSFINSQLEHDLNLLESLYGEDAFDRMNSFYTQQIENTKKSLSAAKNSVEYWKKLMDNERAKGEEGDKEALQKYTENWKSATEEVNSLIEEWADHITSQYEKTIDNIMNKLNNSITKGKGLEYISEEMDLLEKNAKNYLDNINSAYEVQKLTNKWQEAINKTDSVSAQKELNHLMQEQMKMLKEKGRLTQYDIDRAEKEYQIALKQIALKEAQQNKSQMRLKRDANGNYSYEFVSDQDRIRKAEQELINAQNSLYNFDKEAYNNNLNEIYSIWNEFQQKVAEAYKNYGNDQVRLTEELALLEEQYGEKVNFLTEQNLNIRNGLQESAFINLAEMYGIDYENFTQMTEAEKALIMEDLVPQWTSGVQDMIDTFAGEGGFYEICDTTFKDLSNTAEDFRNELIEIQDTNTAASEQIYLEGQNLIGLSQEMVNAAQEEYERIGEVINQVEALQAAYAEAKAEAIDATAAAYNFMQTQASIQDFNPTSSSIDSDPTNSNKTTSSSKSSIAASSSNSTSSSADSAANTNSNKNNTNSTVSNEEDSGSSQTNFLTNSIRIKDISSEKFWDIAPLGKYTQKNIKMTTENVVYKDKQGSKYRYLQGNLWAKEGEDAFCMIGDTVYFKKGRPLFKGYIGFGAAGFDTGGYTGSWGPEGKMAMLHQKEIVLNQHDTSNLLSAVNVLRGVVDSIGNSTLSHVSSLLSNVGSYTPTMNTNTETFDQNVYIDAKFEGQTDALQIQTALENLTNIASQRANHFKNRI